jgi:LmeA-like phospholipid-binding
MPEEYTNGYMYSSRRRRRLRAMRRFRERPSVSLGAFPFLPEVVSGNVSSVTVQANGPVGEGKLPIHELTLTLQDVSFSPSQLAAGGSTTIRARSGDGTAQFTQNDLNAALGASVPITVRFEGRRLLVRTNQGSQEFEARPSVSKRRLLLTPVLGALPELSIALPRVLAGITYREVRIEGDTAMLSFTLSNVTLEIDRS